MQINTHTAAIILFIAYRYPQRIIENDFTFSASKYAKIIIRISKHSTNRHELRHEHETFFYFISLYSI